LCLDEAEARRVSGRGAEVRVVDLAGTDDLDGLLDGAEVVIHCAGVVRRTATRSEFWAGNVRATERLLAAAARARTPRFVHLSSVGVYGHAAAPVAEDAPKRPIGAYGESKWAAEQALWRYHAEHGLAAVALRPCPIYGPRDVRITEAIRNVGRMRMVPLPHGGRRLIDLAYVSDVAEASLAAATAPAAVGRAYNLTDGERHSYRDVLVAVEQVTGRRPAILPVPGGLLVAAVRLAAAWRRRRGAGGDWPAHVERARALGLDVHYSIEAARRDLAYRPKVGLTEGLRRMLLGAGERAEDPR
jgi:nucleoside-diphosphate-sugar epimerase